MVGLEVLFNEAVLALLRSEKGRRFFVAMSCVASTVFATLVLLDGWRSFALAYDATVTTASVTEATRRRYVTQSPPDFPSVRYEFVVDGQKFTQPHTDVHWWNPTHGWVGIPFTDYMTAEHTRAIRVVYERGRPANNDAAVNLDDRRSSGYAALMLSVMTVGPSDARAAGMIAAPLRKRLLPREKTG